MVLLSGGLDSTVVLALALAEGFECHALSVDYGQRHRHELRAALRVGEALGVADHRRARVSLPYDGALTDDTELFTESRPGLAQTFLPGRNTLMLALAAGWAETIGAEAIFVGANLDDQAGYPDCRPAFFDAFESTASLGGGGFFFTIRTPLIDKSKAEIVALGERLGAPMGDTSSCYSPASGGAACGTCDACRLRRSAFIAAGVADPTRYV